MLSTFNDLGKDQVKSKSRFGSGIHRRAEASISRLTAVHRHDESTFAARFVKRIYKASTKKDFVLDGDSMQLARSNAEEGHLRSRVPFFADLEPCAGTLGLPQAYRRRVQESLPGLRSDNVTEQCSVVPLPKPIRAAFLFVRPPHRQVGGGTQFFVDNSAIADRRSYDLISPILKCIE
jgi:hypothetical protein